MTDRFYPVGMPSDEDNWKTTYEVQNEMRSFARSPYPPGCSVHVPGARDKFGFSTPGPIAGRLAKPELCLEEKVDIENPRLHLSIPRYQEPDDRKIFENYDVGEMQRTYISPVASMSMSGGFGSPAKRGQTMLGRSTSLPQIGRTLTRISDPNPAVGKLEDHHFTYFVPKGMQRLGHEKLHAANLTKLQKSAKVTMPLGEGTGFPSQSSHCTWWPEGSYGHLDPTEITSYRQTHGRKIPFHRNSPMYQPSEH